MTQVVAIVKHWNSYKKDGNLDECVKKLTSRFYAFGVLVYKKLHDVDDDIVELELFNEKLQMLNTKKFKEFKDNEKTNFMFETENLTLAFPSKRALNNFTKGYEYCESIFEDPICENCNGSGQVDGERCDDCTYGSEY